MAKRRKYYKRRPYYKKKSTRNYNDNVYKKWRTSVKKRDGYRCQMPSCCSSNALEVHHIKKWADHPALRYCVANGITLCHNCHKSIRGKEEEYEVFFLKILEWNMIDKIKRFN